MITNMIETYLLTNNIFLIGLPISGFLGNETLRFSDAISM